MTGFPRANPAETEYGSGYNFVAAAADGAGSSTVGLPHTHKPEGEYGSGYGLDPAAGHGASGVSARFPHTQTPSRGGKKRKHQTSQLETGKAQQRQRIRSPWMEL